MYLNFYGLKREPFHVTPDPDLLFPTPTHREALAALVYAVEARKGFVSLTGEIGLGKTTLLRSFLQRLDPEATHVVYVFDPVLTFDELISTIFEELELPPRPVNTSQAVRRLFEELISYYERDESVVLVIDDAQKAPMATLESLRILSNLETASSKLMQIILAGQPELDELLSEHRLRQLNQRIAVRARLRPLTEVESTEYLQYRLSRSGPSEEIFTPAAMRRLVRAADGVPRRLNILADNALVTSFGYGVKPVTPRIVDEVVTDNENPYGPRRRQRQRGWLSLLFRGRRARLVPAAVVLLLLGAAALAWRAEPLDVVPRAIASWAPWLGGEQTRADPPQSESAPAAMPASDTEGRGTTAPPAASAEGDGAEAGGALRPGDVQIAARPESGGIDEPWPEAEGGLPLLDRLEEVEELTVAGTSNGDSPSGGSQGGGADDVDSDPEVLWASARGSERGSDAAGDDGSLDALAAGNASLSPVGEVVGVDPSNSEVPLAFTIRRVNPGDTLWNLVGDFYGGVTDERMRAVMRANPEIQDFDSLRVGQTLIFPVAEVGGTE